jgi:hypothetical protein
MEALHLNGKSSLLPLVDSLPASCARHDVPKYFSVELTIAADKSRYFHALVTILPFTGLSCCHLPQLNVD